MKRKLLIIELWGLGDLIIATPFLRAASEKYEVTLLAKPHALDLQSRLWPAISVVPFDAPWTAFKKKYHLWRWPVAGLVHLCRALREKKFDVGLSARRAGLGGDPRDHFLLKILQVKQRIGFPSAGSRIFLTEAMPRPEPDAHRYENWRIAGHALGIALPPREHLISSPPRPQKTVLIHTGARLPVRVWPLEHYQQLAGRLRQKGLAVQIACDQYQENWWKQKGEPAVVAPTTVAELIALTDHAGVFIGNDSGPGHLAALCGVPTFTIFGPQLPEWFLPLHPQADCSEGKACPYKPCSDYCRFPRPFCIQDITPEAISPHLEQFIQKHIAA